jgi:cap2 methyltransferase/cap3/cap4 methyltransferase
MSDDNIATGVALTDADLDDLLGVDEPDEQKGGVTLLAKPDGRFAAAEKLLYHQGCLFREAELAEVRQYSGGLIPVDQMPRTVPRDAPKLPVEYRRRVYGPYDHLPDELLDSCGGPLHTFRYAGHRGQTKLCAGELEAITRALRRCPGLKYVLYAGAAPGEHLVFLAEAFPQLEIHGVDPAEFRVHRRFKAFPDTRKRIFTTRGLFTDELAREWKARAHETIFFSDIRSGDHSQEEFEHEVWQNMQMQLGWWRIMNPAAAMFKFRLPYTDGKVSSACPYLDGEILLQPFGPNTSTEGRLFVWADASERLYDSIAYEDFYFWLNNIVREWASFDCGFDLGLVDGLCRCFDCSRLVQIFREYARDNPAPGGAFDDGDSYVAYLIGRMVEATEQRLLNVPHGDRAAEPLADKRLALAAKHSKTYVQRRTKKIRDQRKKVQHAPPVVQDHVRPPAPEKKAPSPAKAPAPAKTPAPAKAKVTVSLLDFSLAPASSFRAPAKKKAEGPNKL